MLGRGLNPARFLALLEEFRQKITHERVRARLQKVNQEELVALVKLQAEVKARYLVAVLDLVAPNMADLPERVEELRRQREMVDEIGIAVKAIVDGVVAQEIPMPGLAHGPEFSADMERKISAFLASGEK